MTDLDIQTIFSNLYARTSRKTLAYITAKCGSPADIADIFQETYLEVYSALKKRGPDFIQNEEAFILKIARQKVHRYYSVADRLKRLFPPRADECGETADIGPPPEDIAADRSILANIRNILAQKPEIVKKIFILYYSMNLSIKDISELLSVSESTVKNKLYRTLKELRKLYSPD